MGQIDSDKMYTNIMNWEWGNSGSDENIMIQKPEEKA
jgi:hypothetical protein